MSDKTDVSKQHFLFDNDDTSEVWLKACEIIKRINPDYDFSRLSAVFRDVIGLFAGQYPGYSKINTLYHDMRHTMDVFMCALRLAHGAHLAGKQLSDEEVTIIAVAALMHDIGYAKQAGDGEGTGAKYTRTHVSRGINFMRLYLTEKNWPASWAIALECALQCTDPMLKPSDIEFPDERVHLIGMLVGTADLVGQMADRSYLEKLLFLYFEFKEAGLGAFDSIQDLLLRTREFYTITKLKLDEEFNSTYNLLNNHFKDWFNVDRNYYMVSMTKNIDYLTSVIEASHGANFLQKLKRRGIVEEATAIAARG